MQLPFLQPHFVVQRPPFQVVLRKLQHGTIFISQRLTPSPLPTCPEPDPMDVISFVPHCPTCEHLVETYVQCWRPPFTRVVSQWWSATTHVGERRNYFRGLVPMSLYTKFTNPPSGRSKPAQCHGLKLAVTARVPLFLNALYRTLEWLKDHLPPSPLRPFNGPNPWRRPWLPYNTSHTAQQRPPPPTNLPPPSQTSLHTSLQSAPAPLPRRHRPKLENTPASPVNQSALYH